MPHVKIALVVAAAAVLSGCASEASGLPATAPVRAVAAEVASASAKRCEPGSVQAVGSPRRTLAAVVRARAVAFRKPGRGRIAEFGRRNVNGVPTVFAVLARRVDARCRTTWYRVQLPLRPNGIVGWVRAALVRTAPVTTRIHVDLSSRRVTLFDRGRRVLTARAAIGTSATPTPTGRFYVNQRLVPRDPSGPFGPGAVGISAFSDVLTGWAQGGPIAIHGTNRPELIGSAVSNGCVRLRNDDLRALFGRALAGTPVRVTA